MLFQTRIYFLFLLIPLRIWGQPALSHRTDIWVLPLNGDTLFCQEADLSLTGTIKCITVKGLSKQFNSSEVTAYRGKYNHSIFGKGANVTWERHPEKPQKEKSGEVFMYVLLNNGHAKLLEHTVESVVYTGTGTGGMTRSSAYYLFENNLFICEMEKKNCNDLLGKYFGDCPYILKRVGENKNNFKNIEQIAREYEIKCARNELQK